MCTFLCWKWSVDSFFFMYLNPGFSLLLSSQPLQWKQIKEMFLVSHCYTQLHYLRSISTVYYRLEEWKAGEFRPSHHSQPGSFQNSVFNSPSLITTLCACTSQTPLPTSLIFIFTTVFVWASICYHTIIFALRTLDPFLSLRPVGRRHNNALNTILNLLPPWPTQCASPWYWENPTTKSLFYFQAAKGYQRKLKKKIY